MICFYKELLHNLKLIWYSKFKLMLILFFVWLYRVDFMPDTGGGLAKVIQVTTILGLFYQIKKYAPNITTISYSRTNISIKSCLWLYTYALISTLWAFVPSMALFISFQNLVMIMLLIWYFSMFRDFISIEKAFIFLGLSIVTFESIFYRIYNPSVIIHFLGSASSGALCFVYCATEWMKTQEQKRKQFLKHAMIIALILMVTSTSSGANASAIFGFGLACLFAGRAIWAAFIVGCGLFLFFNQDMINEIILTLNPGKTIEMIESGNGRETIWKTLMQNANQRPIFGWGFACIERTAQNVLQGQILSDAHSNYIGIYGSLGMIGIIFFFSHIIFSSYTAVKYRMRPGCLGLFTAIAAATMNGYSYGFLSGKTCSITVIYFALIILTLFYSKIPYRR